MNSDTPTPPAAEPIEWLRQLEAASIGNAAIAADARSNVWRGFVFELNGTPLVAPFDGEYEIAACGEVSPLPLCKHWLRGMVNIRGEIYTLVDLAGYLNLPMSESLKNASLLLLPDDKLKSALLINGKISLRFFPRNARRSKPEKTQYAFAEYLSAVVHDDNGDKSWGVLDLPRLTKTDSFCQVGLA